MAVPEAAVTTTRITFCTPGTSAIAVEADLETTAAPSTVTVAPTELAVGVTVVVATLLGTVIVYAVDAGANTNEVALAVNPPRSASANIRT